MAGRIFCVRVETTGKEGGGGAASRSGGVSNDFARQWTYADVRKSARASAAASAAEVHDAETHTHTTDNYDEEDRKDRRLRITILSCLASPRCEDFVEARPVPPRKILPWRFVTSCAPR